MFTPGIENCINTLRIVGDVDDSLAFQLRLQSLLSSTNFSIPGVSPASVVCIRSLPDPRPRTLRMVRSELEGAGAWSKALTQSLSVTVNRAVRPANGIVPSNADCILFADRAEMLACLASDWLSGLLWSRWWWKILLPAGHSSEIVKHLWRDHPQFVPAALDRLSRESKAMSFVNALTGSDCRELLQQTLSTFLIQQLNAVCQISLAVDQANVDEALKSPASSPDLGPHTVEQTIFSAPWEIWCPELSTAASSPERQRFLGIVLTIARAPSSARSREFARAVEHWQEQIINVNRTMLTGRPPVERSHDHPEVAAPAAMESVDSATDTLPEQSAGLEAPESQKRQLTRDPESRRSTEPARARSHFGDSNDPAAELCLETAAVVDESDESIIDARTEFISEMRDVLPEPVGTEQLPPATVTFDGVVESPWTEIETQLGGFFYLINLALYLNLYGDFTMPAAPEIELNIWDFVSLMGAELTSDEDAEDPIWEWLAKMSGREADQHPGEGFRPPDSSRPEWWSTLMPDVRARLRTALGVDSDDHAARMLCRHYARIRATDTHLDVFFVLADLPLEIRFAGLDRDPGWVPAAGRFIAFHFD
jgi:hypothetical protein